MVDKSWKERLYINTGQDAAVSGCVCGDGPHPEGRGCAGEGYARSHHWSPGEPELGTLTESNEIVYSPWLCSCGWKKKQEEFRAGERDTAPSGCECKYVWVIISSYGFIPEISLYGSEAACKKAWIDCVDDEYCKERGYTIELSERLIGPDGEPTGEWRHWSEPLTSENSWENGYCEMHKTELRWSVEVVL